MKKTPFPPRPPFALLALLPLLVMLCCPPLACAIEVDAGNALAAADTSGGYSGQVLAKVSRLWAPPPDTVNRRVSLHLRIDGDGNLSQCDFTTASDMAVMNKAACEAVREAGNFGVPPYGMPTEVYMTFWTGRPRKAPKESTVSNAPKSIPVAAPMPASGQAQSRAHTAQAQALAQAPGKTPAHTSTQTPAAPKPSAAKASDAAPTTKAPPAPSKPSRGGLSGGPDAATTPIKSSASKSTPPKTASGKPDTAKMEDGKDKAATVKQQLAKSEKPEKAEKKAKAETPPAPSKPAGIRTQFAPYRDPKAKPIPEQQVMPSGAQQHYVQEITAHFQMRLIPPDKLKSGKYTVSVKLGVNGGGEVGEAELARSSGQPVLDEAVLRLLLRAEKVLAPPNKQPQNLNLTFTVHKP